MSHPLANDLDHILQHTASLWDELRGKRIFMTGGTGFFGCWLLESFAWANDKLGLHASAWVLTRNPEAFRLKAPHLANHPAIRFHVGDVRSFEFPAGEFSHIIHAATESNIQSADPDPVALFEANIRGTHRTLEFARLHGVRSFLLTSSGAVYGRQPPSITHITEDYSGAPETVDTGTAYGHGKRVSEFMCATFAHRYGLQVAIARCFAFVGPYLPLDSNYAIGNFIRDALQGESIRVKGDGTPYRSYLYAADLAIWLWTLLFKGQPCHPYNVGSEVDLTICDLAHQVAHVIAPHIPIHISKPTVTGRPPERYVPSTQRALTELGLTASIALPDAIQRTASWYSSLGLAAMGTRIDRS